MFRGQHFTRPLSKSNVHSTKISKDKEPSVSRPSATSQDWQKEGKGGATRHPGLWLLSEGRGRLDYVRLMRGDRAKLHQASCGLSDPPYSASPAERLQGLRAKAEPGTQGHCSTQHGASLS